MQASCGEDSRQWRISPRHRNPRWGHRRKFICQHFLFILIVSSLLSQVLASTSIFPWSYSPHTNAVSYRPVPQFRDYPACGGSLQLSSGSVSYIASPRFPEAYPPNSQCRWNVHAPYGSRVLLTFEQLLLPRSGSSSCTADYVEVTDAVSNRRFCHTQYGGAMHLNVAPSIMVGFVSDRVREDFPARFRMRLEASVDRCGGDIVNTMQGELASPGHPQSYPPNTICSWRIQGPVSSRIRLDCSLAFWLEPSPDCSADALVINLSGDDNLQTSQRFCGIDHPSLMTSDTNRLTVIFHSNAQYQFTGFRCRYEVLTNTVGNSVYNNGVTNYPNRGPAPSPPQQQFSMVQQQVHSRRGCDCGRANKKSSREARIVGGIQTEVNAYPWVVAIFKQDGRQYCAGSLITEVHILTVGHCVARLAPNEIFVSIGDHDLDISIEARHLVAKVRRIIVHPGYRSTPVETDDIAILELVQPMPFSLNIRPVCLPPPGGLHLRGEAPTVVGWGKLSEAGLSTSVLRETTLPIQPNSECQRAYGFSVVTDNMICAGQLDGTRDACQGDSGGPMMIRQDSNWYIIGLVSYGFGCARPEFPGVYTRIDRYLEWIFSNVPPNAPSLSRVTPPCQPQPAFFTRFGESQRRGRQQLPAYSYNANYNRFNRPWNRQLRNWTDQIINTTACAPNTTCLNHREGIGRL